MTSNNTIVVSRIVVGVKYVLETEEARSSCPRTVLGFTSRVLVRERADYAAEDRKNLGPNRDEMNSDLIRKGQATAQVMASQKQLENKYKAAQKTADDWYKQRNWRLKNGDSERGVDETVVQENADGMKENLLLQKEAVEKLVSNTSVGNEDGGGQGEYVESTSGERERIRPSRTWCKA